MTHSNRPKPAPANAGTRATLEPHDAGAKTSFKGILFRSKICVLSLLHFACSGLAQDTGAPLAGEGASSEVKLGTLSQALGTFMFQTPDVVLDLADNTNGWTGSNNISAGAPREGEASLSTVGSGTTRFEHRSLTPVDVSAMRYLTFWYYVSDVSKIRTDTSGQVEISSSRNLDNQEMNWSVNALGLQNGWNFVRLELPGKLRSTSGVPIDLAAIKRFRLYHPVSGSVATSIDDIRFTNRTELVFGGCQNAVAHRTDTGGASFNRGASYSATGCADAYVVDLYDYSEANTGGTGIAYNEALPTTEAACESTFLTVGVWECLPASSGASCNPSQSGASRVFLGEAAARGIWVRNPVGTGICRMPRMTLGQQISEYQPTGRRDFKIAIRAENGSAKQRSISFATVALEGLELNTAMAVRDEIDDLPSGAIHDTVTETWAKKGTSIGARTCRAGVLELSFMQFLTPFLTKAGAASADVNARISAYTSMRSELCDPGGSQADFQAALRDFLAASVNIQSSIDFLHWELGIATGLYGDFPLKLLDQLQLQALGLLASNCQPSTADIYRYLKDGVLPQGVTANRLLYGTCSDTKLSNLASSGAGGTLTPGAVHDALLDCIAPGENPVCSDPRAQVSSDTQGQTKPDVKPAGTSSTCRFQATPGGPWRDCRPDETPIEEVPPEPQPVENCEHQETPGGPWKPCNSGDMLATTEWHRNAEADAAVDVEAEEEILSQSVGNRAGVTVVYEFHRPTTAAEKLPLRIRWGAVAVAAAVLTDGLSVLVKATAGAGVGIGYNYSMDLFAEGYWRVKQEGPKTPFHNQIFPPPRYCPVDWAPGGSYTASISNVSNGVQGRSLDEDDRIEHCLCEILDASYVATGTPSLRASMMCPSKRERVAHHCLASQWGPDDPIPDECLNELEPAHTDNHEWMARICQQIQCQNGQRGTPVGDHCECEPLDKPALGDPTGALCAQLGWALRCEEGTECLCVPLSYGNLPYNDPSCLNDPAMYPGSTERLTTPTPERVFVFADPRTPTDRFLAFRDDSPTASRVVSAVLPPLQRSTLAEIGTGMRTKIVTTEAAASGQVHLYVHNPENGVNHEFIDHCEIAGLLTGQPAPCNFTPTTSLQRTMWSNCLSDGACSMELTTMGTPGAFDGVIGVSQLYFDGPMTQTGNQPRRCPSPVPEFFARRPNTLWEQLGGTPQEPVVDLELGGGGTVEVPPRTFTIDPTLWRFINPG